MKSYKIFSLAFLFIISSGIFAQSPRGGKKGGQNMSMGHFYGKILEATTSKPIDAASVQLIQSKFDTTTKKRKDVIISGMLTDKKGEFSLENLPVMGNFKLKISAIGYVTLEEKVSFDLNTSGAKNGDYTSMLSAIDKDLGNFKLQFDAKQLENVTVTASKPLLTMSIDRKVYNVEKDITAAGGTAIDVMKNVPSVNVDLDGNVTMRNASPQIFVDGRPTTMTLDQIPADAISTVELITNPSAKFDASGGGAGILNIVLKKNRKVGYNGGVRAGIDSRGKPSIGGDINIRQQKVNFFVSGALNSRKSISSLQTTRTDFLTNSTLAHLYQTNGPTSNGFMGFGRAGADFFIDNRNTITIGGNYSKGKFKSNDLININRDTVFTDHTGSDYGTRNTSGTRDFKNIGSSISYKHNFAKANKSISADVNYNYSKNINNNDYTTQYFYSNNVSKSAALKEQFRGGGTNSFLTAQVDYENPITDKIKIETGARVALRSFTSYNDNFIQNSDGSYYTVPLLNNEYEFTDRVIAAYGTLSHQIRKFSYQLGLRTESSKYDGNLISKSQTFSNEFPLSFFPSVYMTYKLNDKQDIQLNYSRKINRPNFFQLLPFIDFTDSLNLSKGNPSLIPEFTNLLELSYQLQINKNHNLLSTVYFKNTENLITRYQAREVNPNPDKLDSVIMTTYANASSSYQYGIELTSKNKIAKWWDVTTSINMFNGIIKASNLVNGVNSEKFSWFVKLNNSFKLPKNFSAQISGNYQAKTLIPPSGGRGGGSRGGGGGMFGPSQQTSAQGYINPLYDLDIAFKKEFLKNNAASISLQFNDIFRVRKFSSHSESVYFVQDNTRIQDQQVVRLNFNFRFGKMDVSLFKRKNMKEDTESSQNNVQGM